MKVLAIAFTCCLGCSSPEKLTEKLSEKIRITAEPHIAALTALEVQPDSAPASQPIQPAPSPAPVFASDQDAETNAIVVLDSELRVLRHSGRLYADLGWTLDCIDDAASLVKSQVLPYRAQRTPETTEMCLGRIERLRYVLVLRVNRSDGPRVVSQWRYSGGDFGADALLFELPSKKYLGAFPISFTLDERVEGGEARLQPAFRSAIRSTLRGEMRAKIPGAKVNP